MVATFILAKETTRNIAEALKMVSDWNSGWEPEFWLTDFDQREISALEKIFPGTAAYIFYTLINISTDVNVYYSHGWQS